MSTHHSLYFHLIWSTKYRQKLITEVVEVELCKYINGVIRNNAANLLQIGGMPDHIHILVQTKPTIYIPDLVKDIKVSSAKMMKAKFPFLVDFAWQDGYGIFSVSKSVTSSVVEYIKKQKEHHSKHTFEDEFIKFLKLHEVQFDEKYIFD